MNRKTTTGYTATDDLWKVKGYTATDDLWKWVRTPVAPTGYTATDDLWP